eukprot:2774076-Pleurochrysis_carterae.AAC.1
MLKSGRKGRRGKRPVECMEDCARPLAWHHRGKHGRLTARRHPVASGVEGGAEREKRGGKREGRFEKWRAEAKAEMRNCRRRMGNCSYCEKDPECDSPCPCGAAEAQHRRVEVKQAQVSQLAQRGGQRAAERVVAD